MMKKGLAVLLALVLLLGMCVIPANAEDTPSQPDTTPPTPCEGADVWDGDPVKPTKTAKRDGVVYYEISTCEELAYIAQPENTDWLAYNYILTNDLILNEATITWDESGTCTNPDGQLKQWTPIGNSSHSFAGKFDGQGHIISGLYIDRNSYYCGLFGYCSGISNLTLVNSYVKGRSYVGGMAGYAVLSSISNCVNYGFVKGADDYVGGIIGRIDFYTSSISNCVNYGSVSGGGNYVGGIAGYAGDREPSISNCANLAAVTGATKVGGIVGENQKTELTCCYNIGTVTATDEDGLAGGISGSSDHWLGEKSTITNCYYAKDAGLNETIYAFGNHDLADDEENVAEAKTLAQLKNQATFVNWNFTYVWAIDENKNGGYPYPAWLDPGDAVPVTGVSLKESTLSMAVGDVVYLTPSFSPTNASNTACTWTSSNSAVVAVENNGRVEVKKAGSATLTVTTADGGFTAACTVTVTGRTNNDYRLGALVLRNDAGETLGAIPRKDFWVTVPVTKLSAIGNVNVLLVTYDDSGKFIQMFHADVSELPQNTAIKVGFYVKNSGNVARVKAFAISSFGDLTPLAPAAEFPSK